MSTAAPATWCRRHRQDLGAGDQLIRYFALLALDQIGDRRSVTPLAKALLDQGRGDLQRALAAVAIGAVADRARLPWHAEISTDIDYRAAVETPTNQQSGVLDIR